MTSQIVQILGVGLAVLLLVGGIALLQALRSRRRTDERQALASRNGWTYVPDVDGQQWRITGTFGVTAFVAEAQRPRHDSPVGAIRANRTRVVVQIPGSGIRIAPTGLPALPGAGDLVAIVAGEHAKRLGMAPLVPWAGPFGERYEVRAENTDAAEGLLDERLRAALLGAAKRWPGSPPIVTRLDGVLTVTLGEDLTSTADIDTFIGMARAVVESARGAR